MKINRYECDVILNDVFKRNKFITACLEASLFLFTFYLLNCITDILNIVNNHCYRSASFVHYMHIHNSKKDCNIVNNIMIKYCTNTV